MSRHPRPHRRIPTFAATATATATATAAILSPFPLLAAALPTYTIRPLGLPGYQSTTPTFLTPTGRSAGSSATYNGFVGNVDQSVWVDDGHVTHPAGLTGPDYTGSVGQFFSDLLAFNDAGYAIGYSRRYLANPRGQRTPWLFDPSTNTSTRLGYTGDGFTSSAGLQSSTVQFLDDAGRAYGFSVRYDATSSAGALPWVYRPADHSLAPLGYDGTPGPYTPPAPHTFSTTLVAANRAGQVIGTTPTATRVYAWRYDANTDVTLPLGLIDAEHTAADGHRSSIPTLLNETGFVAGASLRYPAGTGNSAWLFDPQTSTTTRIGLTDAAHTDTIGAQSSSPLLINPAGHVAGTSQQYTRFNQFPNAFVYDGHTSIPLGLTDPAHTTPYGGHASTPTHLDSAGRVAGYSYLYQPDIGTTTVPSGQTAWLYDPATHTTTPLGLTGPGYVSNSGRADSQITHLRDAGPVAGTSERFNTGPTSDSNDYAGWTPWVFDPATNTTTPVGLSGGIYTNHDLQLATLTSLNDAGQALGFNWQIDPLGSSRGKTAWFYDPATHSTIPLVFSTQPDGFSYSDPFALTPDGTVFGSYRLYAPGSTDFTSHLFRWSLTDGFADLGDLLSPLGPVANGFFSLDSLSLSTPTGLLAGTGTPLPPTPGQSLAFLLIPVTPEPSSPLPAATAFVATLATRRRPHRTRA